LENSFQTVTQIFRAFETQTAGVAVYGPVVGLVIVVQRSVGYAVNSYVRAFTFVLGSRSQRSRITAAMAVARITVFFM